MVLRGSRRSDGWFVAEVKVVMVVNVSFHRGDVFVTDEGGDGDYLHSILGMQTVSFFFLAFLDFSYTTCTWRLEVQVVL